jgi:micrococcal nuclease
MITFKFVGVERCLPVSGTQSMRLAFRLRNFNQGALIACASDRRVDTPETKHPTKSVEHFGKEAAAFTRRMVEGKRVRLEFDPANAARAHKDNTQQRRTLAYVFLEDGTLLNAEIIKQGYGFAYTRFPFARVDEFRRLEREAREQACGLWALK